MRKWKDHQGAILDAIDVFEVIDCERCGFKHIVPVPTSEELGEIYRQEYYTKEKPLYLERAREDLAWWNLAYGDRYDTFEQHLPLQRRRILDVGSGPGFFLLHGKQRGWDVLGIEPSVQAVNHTRDLGLEVVDAFLDDQTADKLGKFDVVHMSEVLEHIPDPVGMVRLAYNLLKPDGLICIVVPNDYSPFQHALRAACGFKPWWVLPPHHINYFDFNSLQQVVANAGFEILQVEATFPIDIFLLMGDNYVGNDSLGRQCHQKRKMLEQNLAAAGLNNLRRELYKELAFSGIGREIILFGKKLSGI